MASRRNRTGSRWTPTKPALETSVAVPPEAGEAGAGEPPASPAQPPSVDDFIRSEAAEAAPGPVEAALARTEASPPEAGPVQQEPEQQPEQEPAVHAVQDSGPPASAAAPEPDVVEPVADDEPPPAAPVAAPVHVGFPRRGETVRAASTPLSEINATLASFVRSEGQAALAHLDALSKATSPADAIRLQFGEIQRAADASLTCFGALLRTANRFGFSPPRS